jgi:cysteine synthase A
VLRRRLAQLGAEVCIVDAPAARGGYQRARLDCLQAIAARTPEPLWINQYDNPANAAAYADFAAQLVDGLGRIDCLVGTVGSGGSMCGTARYLRALFPDMHVVGVDTFGSVLFGQPDGPRQLRGLGNSLLPENLDHTVFDEVHWVSAAEAFTATRALHAQTSLFRGGTSGACWLVAREWSTRHPDGQVVCIFPDEGHRYVTTIYDDEYMARHDLLMPTLPRAPRIVSSPLEAGPAWSSLAWGRRTYEGVMGSRPALAAVNA